MKSKYTPHISDYCRDEERLEHAALVGISGSFTIDSRWLRHRWAWSRKDSLTRSCVEVTTFAGRLPELLTWWLRLRIPIVGEGSSVFSGSHGGMRGIFARVILSSKTKHSAGLASWVHRWNRRRLDAVLKGCSWWEIDRGHS